MLKEREKNILELLVRDYIRTAEPVSSERMARQLHGTLSPASVRNVFSILTNEGFITQPHTSGGRIPSVQGYRFFVDEVLARSAQDRVAQRIAQVLGDIRTLQERMARNFRVLTAFGEGMPVGFDEVFREPEFAERDVIKEMSLFLDRFERQRDAYRESLENDPFRVYIGEENPVERMHSISVVVGRKGRDDVFFVAGPTRMNYEGIIGTVRIWMKNE
jgi:transcriptional regulator of heat shock response